MALTPEQYLEFAIRDLESGGDRGRVNSFGNSKRCIHLIVDELLWQYGLLAQNARMNFPNKLSLLDTIGILSARILQRLNVQRNEMEHEYVAPSVEAAQDAVDVAGLLTLAASALRRKVISEAVVGEPGLRRHSVLNIDRSNGRITFRKISAPASRFRRIEGVRCFAGILRIPGGGSPGDVTVAEGFTKKIDLRGSNPEEWKPIIARLMDVQRSSGYTESPYIGYPLTQEIANAAIQWMDVGLLSLEPRIAADRDLME
ncbi:hypothetical protein ACWCO9_23120 [Streptomyces sp. NPDC001937]